MRQLKLEPPYGGLVLAFEPVRTGRVAKELYIYGKAVESFSAADWDFRRREIVLLSLQSGERGISALALMERMYGSGGTARFKMRLFDPVFVEPIPAADLRNILSEDSVSTAEHVRRIDHETWNRLLAEIKRLRPGAAEQIDALVARREEDRRLMGEGVKITRLMEQRDAIGLVLDIGNMDRKQTLESINPKRIPDADSVLDLLDDEPMHEQDLVRHDQEIFRSLLDGSMRNARITRKNGSGIRIHVHDNKRLEHVLGTDLLIYQEAYRSFLLLQYKNMERVGGRGGYTWSYKVDDQMWKQIALMRGGQAAIDRAQRQSAGMSDWRLHDSPFYVKFCETTRPSAGDASLVRGMLLQLEHLERFLEMKESEVEGSQARRIGYNNCSRYLNNTQFVELAREGWIGCDQRGLDLISAVIAAGQEGGRTAMLAVIEGEASTSASERGWRNRKG